ncbi:MAG: aminopeptidase [Oscillatoriales cyanobacterium]|nr:MAG: aminopeptidase [Oscillatoriales cyanobacterium]
MSRNRFLELLWGVAADEARSFQLPGAKPHYTPDRPAQVQHIALDLVLDLAGCAVTGRCAIDLLPVRDGVDRLTLDAVAMAIASVQVDGQAQPFEYDGETLQVQLLEPMVRDRALKLVIGYSLNQPQRGIYFVQPTEHYPQKNTQVWTQGEDEDSRFWFPCFDFPGQLCTSEIRVQIPSGLIALSNGSLIEQKTKGKTAIFHWHQRQPHPIYLFTLAVGNFAEVRDEWQGIPVTYYAAPDRADQIRYTMGKTPAMVEFLSQVFDYAYPYEKYAQACIEDFIFGGMENTSMTLLTDRCLLDERATIDNRSSEALVVHELAHQWFGDLLAIKHWSHAWVKEGMATYSETLWMDHEYGAEEAAYYRLGDQRAYLSEDRGRYRRPMVTHIYREAIELYDCHIYEKGGCVYHMLRTELGDDLFWKSIQHFVKTHAFGSVETIDLVRSIEQSTGRNVLPLFDQYVLRGGHPDFKVSYSWDGEHKIAKLTVVQTQAKEGDLDTLFNLTIPVAFGTVAIAEPSDQGKTKKSKKAALEPAAVTFKTIPLALHDREQTFYFPLEQKPDFVSFDPGNHWLKTIELDYPLPELKAQLQHDPDPISRLFAAKAIAQKGNLEALNALAAALTGDRFWGVRAEVADNLAGIALDGVLSALALGLKDPEARARRAVIQAIGSLKTEQAYRVLEPVAKKGDPSYLVEAAALSAIGTIAAAHPSLQESAIALLKSALKKRAGWNEVVRSGAIAGLSRLKTSAAALELVLDYAQPGIPQALRLTALRCLGSVTNGQEPALVDRVLNQLQIFARESFFLTQMSVVAALGQLETPKAIGILQMIASQAPDGRVRRRAEESVKTVQRNVGSDRAIEQLRQELDQLKKDNQTLRSRMEDWEAKSRNSSPANPE